MTLTERIATAERLIEALQAELIGLRSVQYNYEDSSHCFTRPWTKDGYQRGRQDGLEILQKGEGR